MGWIKIDTTLFHKPEVVRISALLGTKKTETVGLLVQLWTLADGLTEDGFIQYYGRAEIDCLVEKKGFCKALEDVGWIELTADGVTLCKFEKHNGKSAKRRAETSKRVNAHRASRVTNVTEEALQVKRTNRDTGNEKVTPREEKRREYSLRESTPRACAREGNPLPPVPSSAPMAKQVQDAAEAKGYDREEVMKFLLWQRQHGWRNGDGSVVADWEAALDLWMMRAQERPVKAPADSQAKIGAPPEMRVDLDLE